MRLSILVLTCSVCFSGAYAAELSCDSISNIRSGESKCQHLDLLCKGERWWDYGSPRQYKNRDCDWCELGATDEDCVDRYSGEARCPVSVQIDPLPSDYDKWICPGHCKPMPTIPYQLNVVKTRFFFKDSRTQNYNEPNVRTVNMPTAFNTQHSSCDSDQQSADPNTYAVCSISECKTYRSQDNWKSRVNSCWPWSSRMPQMPQMAHLDVFWTGDADSYVKTPEARLHTFSGVKEKKQTISQCTSIHNQQTFWFQSKPCWMNEVAVEQKNKQFSIKPHYTYYRGKVSRSDLKDCRMRVVGGNDATSLVPPSATEWNINSHWENPPTYTHHYYNIQSVFDGMQSKFGAFAEREDKTIARWDFTIPCKDHKNNPQRSTKVYYAESGCNQPTCVDFITKPCYDNIYRFDEMVCTLIPKFAGGPMQFSQFKDKIMSSDQKEPFMSYGNSQFEIWYDAARVQVMKQGTITVTPNQPTYFSDDDTISVSLVRDVNNVLSCLRCFDHDLHGRRDLIHAMDNDIIACRPCLGYEKVIVTSSSINYQDCAVCDPHQVRNEANAKQCMKCQDDDPLTPMRRKKTDTTGHTVCTTCQHFQYFRGDSDAGCIFLQTVTDNIKVVNKKAVLSGKDFYITGDILQEIDAKFWRDNILPTSDWNKELVPAACIARYDIPTTNVPRLWFTAWCGHREMLRHQQAWVQVNDSSLYVPLNGDLARTRINTSVVELCGASALTPVLGNTTFDLACGSHKFSLVRAGFQDACTLCVGAKYTDKCWPTYVDGLDLYDAVYFDNKALTPQPGTCENCNARCHDTLQPDSYIDPIPYSCWWNGTGRIPGRLGATATTFAWYKHAPCTKCGNVRLTADLALVVLRCGNRFSYRRWVPDSVTSSADNPDISIPSSRICCVEKLDNPTAKLCTDTPAEFETFTQLNCKKTVDDAPPEFLPYCPLGWYVERTCAKDSPAWNPDCCVKCKPCIGGLFKLDTYKVCPGDEVFDSQDRGCTTKCLTNQYTRNDQCIKCEACE